MIQVAQVGKQFGPVTALDGVSLDVQPGERVAFIGANGSGKTTLLRCVLGLLRFEGTITIAGTDVSREPQIALRSVAYIPQVAPPIEAPVSEVVRTYCSLRGKPESCVLPHADRLGLDLSKLRSKRFRDLSGGMKQKLLAALALSAEAPILVADEPTANLDGEARAAFFQVLDERPRNSVVVLCSHRIDEVKKLVERVVELKDGRVVRDGPLDELLRRLLAFRVEVSLRQGSQRAAEFLVARGFVPLSAGRFEARLGQDEKLAIVAEFLRSHEDAIADLAISPIEDVSAVLGDGRPKLRAVS